MLGLLKQFAQVIESLSMHGDYLFENLGLLIYQFALNFEIFKFFFFAKEVRNLFLKIISGGLGACPAGLFDLFLCAEKLLPRSG